MKIKKSEIWVGVFIISSLCAVAFLTLKATNILLENNVETYRIEATFNNVGGLKIRSPVKIGGVIIGRIVSIALDLKTYTPKVSMDIEKTYDHIPNTSSASIRTSGLLGEQYVALNIGFEDPKQGVTMLKNGSVIEDTRSAVILEDLIGQFLYKSSDERITSVRS